MELTGKCIKVLQPLSGTSARTGEPWVKNSFVIETGGEYSKKCMFTVFGADRWKEFGVIEGGQYQVSFDIDCREYNGKWYNDVSAWKVVRLDGQQQQAPAPAPQHPASAQQQGNGDDSLPF